MIETVITSGLILAKTVTSDRDRGKPGAECSLRGESHHQLT
jgi:hypothetical protein